MAMSSDIYILESELVEITTNCNIQIFELEEYQLIVSTNIESNIYNSGDINLWLINHY